MPLHLSALLSLTKAQLRSTKSAPLESRRDHSTKSQLHSLCSLVPQSPLAVPKTRIEKLHNIFSSRGHNPREYQSFKLTHLSRVRVTLPAAHQSPRFRHKAVVHLRR